MSYQLRIIEKPAYLHAVVTGTNSLDNVVGYLKDLLRECEARQCYNVLIEDRFYSKRAYFLIDSAGVIRWEHVEDNPSNRRSDAELLAAIDAL